MVRNAVLKKLLVAAIVVVGAFSAPALAQAGVPAQWTVGGTPVTSTTPVTMNGTLTLSSGAWGTSFTCNASGAGTVGPGGAGSITAFAWSTPCDTNLPGCTIDSAAVAALPWGTQLTRIGSVYTETVSNLAFKWHFLNAAACGPVQNLLLHFHGSVDGTINQSVTPTRNEFSNTFGLVSPEWGPMTISGFYSLAGPAGAKVAAIP